MYQNIIITLSFTPSVDCMMSTLNYCRRFTIKPGGSRFRAEEKVRGREEREGEAEEAEGRGGEEGAEPGATGTGLPRAGASQAFNQLRERRR